MARVFEGGNRVWKSQLSPVETAVPEFIQWVNTKYDGLRDSSGILPDWRIAKNEKAQQGIVSIRPTRAKRIHNALNILHVKIQQFEKWYVGSYPNLNEYFPKTFSERNFQWRNLTFYQGG